MRVISGRALKQFWVKHRAAEEAIKAWFAEANNAEWHTPQDILERYPTADILPGNRIVFNIKGNHIRLVVKIHYNTGIVYVRFIGTHAEYDRIDAETI